MDLKWLFFALTGLLGGLLGGMGMGGGTLLIPLLTIFTGVSQHEAGAVNLVAFVPMAIVARIMHLKNKLIKKEGLAFVIIPATVLGIAGSVLSSLTDGVLLSKIFGGFLIVLSIVQFFSLPLRKAIESKISSSLSKTPKKG